MLAAHHLVVPGCNLQVLAAVRAHIGLGLESPRPVPKVASLGALRRCVHPGHEQLLLGPPALIPSLAAPRSVQSAPPEDLG